MSLVVRRPGASTTIQDRGRTRFRAFGVPVGGAFDAPSFGLANALVGNGPDENRAVLEMTLLGGAYEATAPLAIALAGAPANAHIKTAGGSSRRVSVPGSETLEPGDRLHVGGMESGMRTYLAVAGGWQTPLTLESRSREPPLREGECLAARASRIPRRRPVTVPFCRGPQETIRLRVLDGPDAVPAELETVRWESLAFRVGLKCDRLGIRLEGPDIPVRPRPNASRPRWPPGPSRSRAVNRSCSASPAARWEDIPTSRTSSRRTSPGSLRLDRGRSSGSSGSRFARQDELIVRREPRYTPG